MDLSNSREAQSQTADSCGSVNGITGRLTALALVWTTLAAGPVHAQITEATEPHTVISASAVWTPATEWRLARRESVQIGIVTGDAEYQLYHVANALRLENGDIVVANAGTGELRIYNSAGRHVRSFGSPGDGPGEFRGLAWVGLVGADSIFAWDSSSARLSLFRVDGTFLGSSTVDAPIGRVPALLGAWKDGLLLGGLRSNSVSVSEGLVRDSIRLVLIDSAGDILSSLGDYPDREYYSRVTASGSSVRTTGVAVPFARNGHTTVAPGGYYYGTGESYEVTFYSRTGEPQRVIRRPVQNQPVTDDVKRSWVQRLAGQSSTGNMRDLQDRMLKSVQFPETLPAYRDLLTDDEGNLWVREYTVSKDSVIDWQVFDVDGKWLGAVEFPHGFEPTHIGPHFVLGIWRDTLEVEHVRMYELVKP